MSLRVAAQESTLEPQLLGSSAVVRKAVSKMYVFGGMGTNNSTPLNKIYEFDMTQRLWAELTVSSSDIPAGRMFHSATLSTDSRVGTTLGAGPHVRCSQLSTEGCGLLVAT